MSGAVVGQRIERVHSVPGLRLRPVSSPRNVPLAPRRVRMRVVVGFAGVRSWRGVCGVCVES
jgi:hypothetical protein